MKVVKYSAFGKEFRQFTFLKPENVEFILSTICPSFHNLRFDEPTNLELELLKSSVPVKDELSIQLANNSAKLISKIKAQRSASKSKTRKSIIINHYNKRALKNALIVPLRYRTKYQKKFPTNWDYQRTHNIFFFEDDVQKAAYFYPQLTIFLK